MSCAQVSIALFSRRCEIPCTTRLISRVTSTAADGQEEAWTADTVVLAVGVKALQGIVQASPSLALIPEFSGKLYSMCNHCDCLLRHKQGFF